MMTPVPVFLSVVCVLRNDVAARRRIIEDIGRVVAPLVSEYELIVVDNASTDGSLALLRTLTGDDGLPNLQVYALSQQVDSDTAYWAGIENALGDFVVAIDPLMDDIAFLPQLLDRAVSGTDVVFGHNTHLPPRSLVYKAASAAFNVLYYLFNGIDLKRDAPQYHVLNRRVVNFILKHPHPALAYRHLPASGAFTRATLDYCVAPSGKAQRRLAESIDGGMRLLMSTTRAPMRLVTALSLFGAMANVAYSVYVVAIGLFKTDVAPGWISLSLQQSGMFFLISLVLLVLGEYILNMARLTNEGPSYHVGQEMTSSLISRRNRLNVEQTVDGRARAAASVTPSDR